MLPFNNSKNLELKSTESFQKTYSNILFEEPDSDINLASLPHN
jgi:hypothetical protein